MTQQLKISLFSFFKYLPFFFFVAFFFEKKWVFSYQTHIQGVDEKEATLAIFQGLFFSFLMEKKRRYEIISPPPPLSKDIGGHSNFSTLRESYMKYNKSFILVYSVTSKASFEEIRSFYEQIQKVKSEDVPIGILIGNKSDLESEREVSTIEGENLGSSLHLPFLETSALLKTNVEEMFQLIVSHTIRGVTNQFRNIKSARQ